MVHTTEDISRDDVTRLFTLSDGKIDLSSSSKAGGNSQAAGKIDVRDT